MPDLWVLRVTRRPRDHCGQDPYFLGHVRHVFASREDAAAHYDALQHIHRQRHLDAHQTGKSDWEPETGLRYWLEPYDGQDLNIPHVLANHNYAPADWPDRAPPPLRHLRIELAASGNGSAARAALNAQQTDQALWLRLRTAWLRHAAIALPGARLGPEPDDIHHPDGEDWRPAALWGIGDSRRHYRNAIGLGHHDQVPGALVLEAFLQGSPQWGIHEVGALAGAFERALAETGAPGGPWRTAAIREIDDA